jgi:hypothetical protein
MRRVFRSWVVALSLAWLLGASALAAPERSGAAAPGWHQYVETAADWWSGLLAALGSLGSSATAAGAGPPAGDESASSNSENDHGSHIDPDG